MFDRAHASGAIQDFKQRVLDNMLRLRSETGMNELAVPVGIFLVIDRENGGNDTGEELIRRFNLIDVESRDLIDFFFLGWSRSDSGPSRISFDLSAFQSCRDALRKAGVGGFGGYADLFVFDAWLRDRRVFLDFEHALHIDLAESIGAKRIPSVGKFLEGLLQSIEGIRNDAAMDRSSVIRISDQLGLAVAKHSVLRVVLDKWGSIIGAGSLTDLATRRVGPSLDLANF